MHIQLSWLTVLHNIWWISRMICATKEESERSKPTCVIEFRGFIEDNLTITWSLPDHIMKNPTDLVPIVNWYLTTEPNYGHCSVVTLTSCVCYYSDVNCMNSDSLFSLNVTILNVSRSMESVFMNTWQFDSENCFRPSPVMSINFTIITSLCMKLKWDCSFLDLIYRISYRRTGSNSTWKRTECDDICNNRLGVYNICGLHPFTTYDIMVQSRLYNSNDEPTGHWSIPSFVTATTTEYVPSGAPGVISNGFSNLKNNCEQSNTREVQVYWKGVDKEYQNGVITRYRVLAEDMTNSNQRSAILTTPVWFYNLTLRCDSDYEVTMTAGTRIGFSPNSSSIQLKSPKHDNDNRNDFNVFPEINHNYTSINITKGCSGCVQGQHVVWCLSGPRGSCEGPLDWKMVKPRHESVLLESTEVTGPLQNFKVGVTTLDNGIQWANCLYLGTNELKPPTNLRAFPSLENNHRIEVIWESIECSSGHVIPYIDSFEIRVCETNHKQSTACSGELRVFSVDGKSRSFIIPGLKDGLVYKISIISVGRNGVHSVASLDIYVQPKYKGSFWKSTTFIVLAVSISVTALFSMLYCIRHLYRKVRHRYTKMCTVEWINLIPLENGP